MQDDKSIERDRADQLTSIIDAAKAFIGSAIADNKQHMQRLGGLAEHTTDPRTLIARLVDELSNAVNRAENLERKFTETHTELDHLRDCLSKADRKANTDELTGLANRRFLNDFLQRAITNLRHDPLSVVLIDIDRFKSINDNYGHLVGDQVVVCVARILQQTVREHDLAARYGGDELMLVLTGADLSEAVAIGERLRRTLEQRTLRRRSTGVPLCTVTASVGAAQYRPGERVDTLLARCDTALYAAKTNGRNRTCDETAVCNDFNPSLVGQVTF